MAIVALDKLISLLGATGTTVTDYSLVFLMSGLNSVFGNLLIIRYAAPGTPSGGSLAWTFEWSNDGMTWLPSGATGSIALDTSSPVGTKNKLDTGANNLVGFVFVRVRFDYAVGGATGSGELEFKFDLNTYSR